VSDVLTCRDHLRVFTRACRSRRGKSLDHRDLRRNRNCSVQLKPRARQERAMFVNRPLLPTCDRQHH